MRPLEKVVERLLKDAEEGGLLRALEEIVEHLLIGLPVSLTAGFLLYVLYRAFIVGS